VGVDAGFEVGEARGDALERRWLLHERVAGDHLVVVALEQRSEFVAHREA
jgi:hypothetical protein